MTRSKEEILLKAAQKALQDFTVFCETCFYIKRKDGTVGLLELNSSQKKLVDAIEKQTRAGKPVRVVILKARQLGMSTCIAAYLLWRSLRGDAVLNEMQLAHDKDSARYLLSIISFAVEMLPEWFKVACSVSTRYFTKFEIAFEHTNSSIQINSAEAPQPGRGRTLHVVHLSEAAFYPDASSLTKALFAAIPKQSPNTAVLIESTGNGPSGFFYDTFTQAQKGLNDYVALFIPWYEHEEYQMPVPDGVEVVCPEELKDLGLTREQLYWRQYVIMNDFQGDEDRFKVEYPATPEEAFLAEAATLFPVAAVQKRIKEVEDIHFDVGYLTCGPVLGPGQVRFVPATNERLHIFKHPEPGRAYLIGADVGSGVVINRLGDASPADVIDVATGEQVAHLWMVAEPQEFGRNLILLGYYYNTALIAVETTEGHGLAVANFLRDNSYPVLYKRRQYDKISKDWVDKLGWSTNKKTKKLMIDCLRADFRNGEIIIYEKATLQEMLTFVKRSDQNDGMGALAGAKDDRVMSLAIASIVRRDTGDFLLVISGQNKHDKDKKEPPASPQNPRHFRQVIDPYAETELGAYL